jgi:hypothetical protein
MIYDLENHKGYGNAVVIYYVNKPVENLSLQQFKLHLIILCYLSATLVGNHRGILSATAKAGTNLSIPRGVAGSVGVRCFSWPGVKSATS